jgi:hypothetical protein
MEADLLDFTLSVPLMGFPFESAISAPDRTPFCPAAAGAMHACKGIECVCVVTAYSTSCQ